MYNTELGTEERLEERACFIIQTNIAVIFFWKLEVVVHTN